MLGLNNVEFFACLPYIIQIPINMKLYDPFLYIIKKVVAKSENIQFFEPKSSKMAAIRSCAHRIAQTIFPKCPRLPYIRKT